MQALHACQIVPSSCEAGGVSGSVTRLVGPAVGLAVCRSLCSRLVGGAVRSSESMSALRRQAGPVAAAGPPWQDVCPHSAPTRPGCPSPTGQDVSAAPQPVCPSPTGQDVPAAPQPVCPSPTGQDVPAAPQPVCPSLAGQDVHSRRAPHLRRVLRRRCSCVRWYCCCFI